MKMKQTYAWAIVAAVPFMTLVLPAQAQDQQKELVEKEKQHELHTACINNSETLSGLFLTPAQKGTFQLNFEQQLKEDAVLEIKNKAGKKVFQKPVSIAQNQKAWSYNVGKLKPDTYLVEVKTSDTTYWTKFKIGQ